MGLRIDVTLEQINEETPVIMRFHYLLNTLQFKEWLQTHDYLCEGPLSFEVRGIRIMVPAGADKWDKAGFSYNDEDGLPIFIPLLHEEVTFSIHRDVFRQKEWTINYTDAPAAQNSSGEG
ncbi:unnamed protein product [marine sediment metagenome]|uniref:Uncharacterized protein n=1 Tax=marine sediment metagenome TaxID=412755 RepID=X0T1V4_9ZZZZ